MSIAAFVAWTLVGYFNVTRGAIHNDEGFYAYASREVMQGKLLYRDFGYSQGPLLPYVQGGLMDVVGYGVRSQRWLNVIWTALSLGIVAALWTRSRMRPALLLGLGVVWCFSRPLGYYLTIGKTYALADIFLILAASTFFWRGSARARVIGLNVACVLALGVRLTAAPAVCVLWLGNLMIERRKVPAGFFFFTPLLAGLAVFGPLIAADPVDSWFWLMGIHIQGALPKARAETLLQSLAGLEAVAVTALGALIAWLRLRRRIDPRFAIIFFAGIVGWLAGVGLPGKYPDYAVPFVPLVMLGSGLLLSEWVGRWSVAVALTAMVVAGFGVSGDNVFFSGRYLDDVDTAGAYVAKNSSPAEMVITSMPEVALTAGRSVMPGLEMGKFGVTMELDETAAAKLHLVTWPALLNAIATERAGIVVLSRRQGANFSWSVPSLLRLQRSDYRVFAETLLSHYHCTFANGSFLVFERASARPAAYAISPAAL